MKACIEFAKKHLKDSQTMRSKILWSDEKKIDLFGDNSKRLLSHHRYPDSSAHCCISEYGPMRFRLETSIRDIFLIKCKLCFISTLPASQRTHGYGEAQLNGGNQPVASGLDLVLVPGLGFDSEGHRLGRAGTLSDKPTHDRSGIFKNRFATPIPVTESDFAIDEVLSAGDLEMLKK
ncbi:unnamed protein product [Ranitomeya imitator]|uniref:5-formyltetrahydrofolate cyclo-ligase n=1 Tax=Ranitomeya imitator TaxID=111125 RepID=A0ABN9KZ91_9NEOB|nr:unnamed protein product [Ranitomeya imitator]